MQADLINERALLLHANLEAYSLRGLLSNALDRSATFIQHPLDVYRTLQIVVPSITIVSMGWLEGSSTHAWKHLTMQIQLIVLFHVDSSAASHSSSSNGALRHKILFLYHSCNLQ